MLQLSLTPRTFSPLDQTTHDLPFAQYARRSWQREIRTACGKRAVTTTIDHPSSTDQTTGLPEDGSVSPGASGQDGSNLETLLRWHRELSRVFWKHTSKTHLRKPRLSLETINLIKEMAANNRLWGAERIRGELLKLDIRVSKRTIQK
jgi:hypothetical protein